jgi:uncharacterized membrane protein (DUF4010 family)
VREDLLLALGVGALCGAAVGTERQWSGHADGDTAHFGGLRTFTLLGLVGGLAGWLWAGGNSLAAALLLGACAALVVTAYAAVSRRDIDATTEVAALVVLGAGVLAGLAQHTIASGMTAATVLLLSEKHRLHGMVRLLDDRGFRAGVRFAVMALVVLPLVPDTPVSWLAGTRPRQLWILVLLFSGLSFSGYVARAWVGERHGLRVTGLLGGLISSTSVTLTFARLSRDGRDPYSLAGGVIAACTVLFPRVVVATAVLAPVVVADLTRLLAAPFIVGVVASLARRPAPAGESPAPAASNPLQLAAALQMTVVFQLVWLALDAAQRWFGQAGLIGSSLVLGLTDVDALTSSLALRTRVGLPADVAASAIALGIMSNTVLKMALAMAIGRREFWLRTALPLGAMVLAGLIALSLGGRFGD